jgi:hypothetical protein
MHHVRQNHIQFHFHNINLAEWMVTSAGPRHNKGKKCSDVDGFIVGGAVCQR